MSSTHIAYTAEHTLNNQVAGSLSKRVEEICADHGADFLPSFIFKNFQKTCIVDFSSRPANTLVTLHIKDMLQPFWCWQIINQHLVSCNKQLLVCHDTLEEFESLSNIKFLTHRSLLGLKHFHVNRENIENKNPSRLFNCFMHRTEAVRQSWFYFLHNRGLLDQGYVSYLLYQFDSLVKGTDINLLSKLELFTQIHTNFGLTDLPHFDKAYHELKDQVPYQNFVENGILQDKILNSKYSLVLDCFSVLDDWNCWFFTEKVARALMLPTIDLLFVQKGMLERLDRLGLVTYSSNLGIDHLPWTERQIKLLDVLESDPAERNFQELNKSSAHNYNQFVNWFNSIDEFYIMVNDTLSSQKNS